MHEKTRKQLMVIDVFLRLLGITGINAMAILRENRIVIEKGRKYLRKLGI